MFNVLNSAPQYAPVDSGVGGTVGLAYYLDPASKATPGFTVDPNPSINNIGKSLFGTNQQDIFTLVGTYNAISQQQLEPVGVGVNGAGTQSYFIELDFTK